MELEREVKKGLVKGLMVVWGTQLRKDHKFLVDSVYYMFWFFFSLLRDLV
jgi:hypothetical protein